MATEPSKSTCVSDSAPPRLRLLFTALGPAPPAPLGDAVPEEDEGGAEEEQQDDHRKVPPNTWEKHTKTHQNTKIQTEIKEYTLSQSKIMQNPVV